MSADTGSADDVRHFVVGPGRVGQTWFSFAGQPREHTIELRVPVVPVRMNSRSQEVQVADLSLCIPVERAGQILDALAEAVAKARRVARP